VLARVLLSLPLSTHRRHDRLYRRLRRRILRPLTLCSEDILRGSGGLEAVRVSSSPRRSASANPLSSTIPGRRTIFSGSSVLGNLTREIKYVTPGKSRSWRWKHEGAVPHSSAVARNAHVGLWHRVQDVWLGRHKQRP